VLSRWARRQFATAESSEFGFSWQDAVVLRLRAAMPLGCWWLLFSCSLGEFGYLSADFGVPGGGTGGSVASPVLPCEGQTDGTPCDDQNVCTRTSICVAGICGGSEVEACSVASSIGDFSMTQGLQEWSYGYWARGTHTQKSYQPDTDFTPLSPCQGMFWRPACVEPGDPSYSWALITAELQHGATVPDFRLPVRRWVSDVSGLASAALDHHHADPGDGDGTRATLLVDGVAVWENEIAGGDARGVQAVIPITLELGTRVELLLDPLAGEARDMTHLSIVIGAR